MIALDDSDLKKYKAVRKNELPTYFKLTGSTIKNHSILKLRLPRMKAITKYSDRFVGDYNFNRVANKKIPAQNYYLDGYFQSCLDQNLFDEMIEVLKKTIGTPSLKLKKYLCSSYTWW